MGFGQEFIRGIRRRAFGLTVQRTMRRRMAMLRAQHRRHLEARDTVPHSPDKLTIVVPCYGHSKFLRTMVKSIAAQTLPPDEVVFVNDNSPDATVETLEACIAEFGLNSRTRCVVVCNEKNLGQAASLNLGIEKATSDVIMVLNDDDYLFHDAVAVAMKVLRMRSHIHMVGGQCIVFADERYLELFNKELLKVWNVSELPLKEYHPVDTLKYKRPNDLNITHSGCSFYKQSWRAVDGYWSEKHKRVISYSDRDFQLRFNVCFPIAILDVPISCWRSNSSVDAGINS